MWSADADCKSRAGQNKGQREDETPYHVEHRHLPRSVSEQISQRVNCPAQQI